MNYKKKFKIGHYYKTTNLRKFYFKVLKYHDGDNGVYLEWYGTDRGYDDKEWVLFDRSFKFKEITSRDKLMVELL